ncbi:glycosyltransferase [Nonomuraea sp. SMC257]|uniref:Glycosyltransferase n=1 Tax=Nonomuraea montanisoli TaxID=2741721 RepID=A0A7Y6M1M8_9ACTN|nr:glycosyltransferase [Nonomuraea montanisoli]NUW30530.1 glycosyltransferase [Nonomuraea montanisoli]
MTDLDVVVISKNEGAQLRGTVDCLLDTTTDSARIIVVDDASDDASADFLTGPGYSDVILTRNKTTQGIARARNIGARIGSAPFIVFSDAHNHVQPGWWDGLSATFAHGRVGAAGPAFVSSDDIESPRAYGMSLIDSTLKPVWLTEYHPGIQDVPILGGGFLAIRRNLWRESGMFDEGMRGFGYEDAELCMRIWLMGMACVVVPDILVAHKFRDSPSYHIDESAYVYNWLRFAMLHLTGRRLSVSMRTATLHRRFAEALQLLLDSDIAARRRKLNAIKRQDDSWFFTEFGISLNDDRLQETLMQLVHDFGYIAIPQDPGSLAAEDIVIATERGKVLDIGYAKDVLVQP